MHDRVGMKLQQRNQFQVLRANRGLQARPVFFDVLARVPLRESQVQDALAIQLARAA